MQLNNARTVLPLVSTLYGISMPPLDFEDILMIGWEKIGNRHTRLHRYTATPINRRITLPCNADHIEAVTTNENDANISSPIHSTINAFNQWAEDFIEPQKTNTNSLYIPGKLISYRQEGEEILLDGDYNSVSVLYHGIITDDEGLPLLTNKEVQALAAFCAYITLYKQSLAVRDNSLFQLAASTQAEWFRLCNAARSPEYLSQNDMNDILDVQVRWDRKAYGKSFKPIL